MFKMALLYRMKAVIGLLCSMCLCAFLPQLYFHLSSHPPYVPPEDDYVYIEEAPENITAPPLEPWEKNVIWNSPQQTNLARETLDYMFNLNTSLSRSVKGSVLDPLPSLRSPCWKEKIIDADIGRGNSIIESRSNRVLLRAQFNAMAKEVKKTKAQGHSSYMRCVPAFYIAGVYESGSNDLLQALSVHENIYDPITKRPLLGLWASESVPDDLFDNYLQLYDLVADDMDTNRRACIKNKDKNCDRQLAIDGTDTLLHSHTGWRHLPWNRDADAPRLIIAHHLKIINPTAKFIFLVREPAQWMESCYNYYRKSTFNILTTNIMHNETESLIYSFQSCLKESQNLMRCVYRLNQGRCNVINSLYYVYIKQWIEIFGKGQVQIIAAEDFLVSRYSHRSINKVLRFLEVPPLKPVEMFKLDQMNFEKEHSHRFLMAEDTKAAIRKFVAPWNRRLGSLMVERPAWS